jgi:histone H4
MATEETSVMDVDAEEAEQDDDRTSSSSSSSEGESLSSDTDSDDDAAANKEIPWDQVKSFSADSPMPAEEGDGSAAAENAPSDVKAAAVVLAAVRRGARQREGVIDVRQNKRHAHKPKRKRKVTEMSIRRLARRAGVTRMSETVFEETRATIAATLKSLVQDAVVYAENGRRKTVTVLNVTCATKRQGHPIYGF